MIKKEILLNPIVRDMRGVKEPPVTAFLDLGKINKDEANQYLSQRDKQRWVDEHNKKGNFYFINMRGDIQDVEPSGWWY